MNISTLIVFLNDFRKTRSLEAKPRSQSGTLKTFLEDYSHLRSKLSSDLEVANYAPKLSAHRFKCFVDKFHPLHEALRHCGHFINLFSITNLKRDEVRNAAVVAWIFDKRESHGQGTAYFHGFLNHLAKSFSHEVLKLDHWLDYKVRTEFNPLGMDKNRVDIIIESSTAILFIEVKINADEGHEQMERYSQDLYSLTKDHKGLVYLTGRRAAQPKASQNAIIHSRWADLSNILKAMSLQNSPNFSQTLIHQFAFHIRYF